MAADAGVSLGVVVSGLLIVKTGLQWIDSCNEFYNHTCNIMGNMETLLNHNGPGFRIIDAVLDTIKFENVKAALETSEVIDLHDLHIWAMSTNENALSVHVLTSTQKYRTAF